MEPPAKSIDKVSGINDARDLRVSHSLSDSIEFLNLRLTKLGWDGTRTLTPLNALVRRAGDLL